MFSLLFSLILCFVSFQAYLRKQNSKMLFCLTVVAFDFMGFGKIFGESPIKTSDIAILTICIIWLRSYYKEKSFFKISHDSLGKSLLYLFLYIFVVFVGTILLSQDTPSYAFKVFRVYLALPFYFVLRKMSLKEFELYFKYMIYASVFQGLFYYLQFVGISGILSGYGADTESSSTDVRLGNYPILADVFFLYFLFKKNIRLNVRLLFLIFWGMMPILGQMRGQTLVLAISICIYLFYKHKTKHLIYIITGYFIWTLIVSPMFEKRADGNSMSASDEIMLVLQHPFDMYKYVGYDIDYGNFIFRAAMLGERIYFMFENPQYALTGVGCVHELSPHNHYVMLWGTPLGEELTGGVDRPAYLSSADNTWVGIVMRFGFIGVLLTLIYYIKMVILSITLVPKSSYTWAIVFGCYLLPNYMGTMDGNSFDRLFGIIIICFTTAFITVFRREKGCGVKNKL